MSHSQFQIDNTQVIKEKILLVGVEFPNDRDFQAALNEAQELIRAVDGDLVEVAFCKREKPSSALFVGTGKAEELAQIVAVKKIDLAIFNHELSPIQERNLEKILQCRVIDRVGLILAIFAKRANTPEAKLQVETAQLTHLSARLVRGYSHLKSQKGGIGLKGPGETQLEIDRRLISQKITRLKQNLATVKKHRNIQRQNRINNQLPIFSLVGYTNVGKSTIFNHLTKSNVLAKDQLFATLDTTTRKLWLSEDVSIILSDTVGFVRNLPHKLIEAFSATLEETLYADILLHVVDASDNEFEQKIQSVQKVLEEIGASEIHQVIIYNKIDLTSVKQPEILYDISNNIKAIRISANQTESLNLLRQALIQIASVMKK